MESSVSIHQKCIQYLMLIMRSLGSTLAYVTQIALVASVGVAYTQWLWRTLSTKALTVECLDAAFDADTAIVSLLNREFVRKVHIGAALAALCWFVPSLRCESTIVN